MIVPELSEVVHLLPDKYIAEYIEFEDMYLYALFKEGQIKGVTIIRKSDDVALIKYLFCINKYDYQEFINDITYDMYLDDIRRVEYSFVNETDNIILSELKKAGFSIEEGEGAVFKFQLENINVIKHSSKNVIALKDVERSNLMSLCNNIIDSGKDFVDMPIINADYDDVCSGIYIEDNIAKGVILLKSTGEIPFVYVNSSNSTAILALISFVYDNAINKYPLEMECSFNVIDSKLSKIIERVIGVEGKKQKKAVFDLSLYEEYKYIFEY